MYDDNDNDGDADGDNDDDHDIWWWLKQSHYDRASTIDEWCELQK